MAVRAWQILLPLSVVIIAGAQVVRPGPVRPIVNQPGVSHIVDLPPATQPTMRRFLDYNAIVLPEKFPLRAPQPGPAALGYGYREVSAMKLPLVVYKELGFVLYDNDGIRTRMIPLDDDYMKLLEAEAGRPLGRGYIFPYWLHLWGWLVAAMLLAALRSWLREQDDKREAAGII